MKCLFGFAIYTLIVTIPCYSNNSRSYLGKLDELSLDEKDITQDQNTASKGNLEQRVVLLVGPHKTSSTSVQTNIIRWTHDNRTLPDWYWPQPKNLVGLEKCYPLEPRPKIFYSYFNTLYGKKKRMCLQIQHDQNETITTSFASIYENEFRNAWSEGKSLVIGSEAIDFVASKNGNGNQLLSRILNGLPWNSNTASGTRLDGSNDDVTVVVKLRTPRVNHLISLWHQCCMEDMSFHEYVTVKVPNTKYDIIRSIDSLRLVEVFLEKDIKVVLIDMEEATEKGYDLSAVVACDILGARCTRRKQIIGDNIAPSITNVQSHSPRMLQVDDKRLVLMERAIRNYDCNFQSIMNHKNITALYSNNLVNIFNDCKKISLDRRIETRQDLSQILADITYGVDEYYNL